MFVDQVRSRTSACDSITIRFKVLEYYITHETHCQHFSQLFFANYTFVISDVNKVSHACSLPLLALYLIQPYNTCMLSVAPLFVVLRKESVERNRVPRQQVDREQNQI